MPNLPLGRYDEVLVHPREHDLVLSGHGYSVWIMDDITALEQMAPEPSSDASLLKPRDAVQWKNDFARTTEIPGEKFWQGENAPRGTAIAYTLKTAATDATISVTNTANGQVVRTCAASKDAGLTRFQWAFQTDAASRKCFKGAAADVAAVEVAAGPLRPRRPARLRLTSRRHRVIRRRSHRPCRCSRRHRRRTRWRRWRWWFGGGGGGTGPGVYKVTLTVNGKEAGSQTFRLIEDVWLNEK